MHLLKIQDTSKEMGLFFGVRNLYKRCSGEESAVANQRKLEEVKDEIF